MRLSVQTRAAIKRARLFLVVVSEHWFRDAHAQAQAAYAQQCGKPFRVLVVPGTRLPETAFQGVRDLRIVQSQGTEADVVQI